MLAVTPIPGAAPFGLDPLDDPRFEAVEAQIDKLQTDPAAVAWARVAEGAVQILETRAKDWRIACRLTMALYQTNGFEGLALGLAVLRDLMDESRWLQIFPPPRRAKMRGAYLDWLAERLVTALDKEPEPDAGAAPFLTDAVASLEEIDARVGVALGDFAPILHRLTTRLGQLQVAALARAEEAAETAAPVSAPAPLSPPPPAAAVAAAAPVDDAGGAALAEPPAVALPAFVPAAVQAAPAPVTPAPTPAPAPAPAAPPVQAPPMQLGGDSGRALRDIKNALVSVAATLREQRLADPRPYAMLRAAIWLELERLPPSQDGVMQLPEPALERRRLFEQLRRQGDWNTLIHEVEKTLASGSYYWLDGQRLVATALEELGPSYQDARAAVVQGLAAILRRYPELARLRFLQGSPVADDLTHSWIGSEVVPAAAAGAPGPGGDAAPWTEVAAQAATLAVKGKVAEALALFREGVARAGGLRERFFWELAQARACVDAGLLPIAAVQLVHLEALVEQFQLEQWEPALALEVAQLYVAVQTKTAAAGPPGQERPELHQRMLARLCRYDVAAAMTLNEL